MNTEVEQIEIGRASLGNTSSKLANRPRQVSQSKRWCFTWNNYNSEDLEQIVQFFISKGFSYIVGQEVAASGTPHLQGYIEKKQRFRPSELKLSEKIHWEKARGTREDNLQYCSKENKFKTNFHVNSMIKTLNPSAFFPYQKWLIDITSGPADDRSVIWIWDKAGNIGKSAIAKYMALTYNAIVVDSKASDIFNGIFNYKEEKGFFPQIIIVDCPRHNLDYMNYGAIEKCKNGLIFNGKYESKMLIFNSPHVIVFANDEPDKEKFSNDRWIIKEIKNRTDAIE